MQFDPPRSYDQLCEEANWPLSRLYHQQSKLSEYKQDEFQEGIVNFSDNPQAIHRSTQAYKTYPTRPQIELPPPDQRRTSRPLQDLLQSRRTRRGHFESTPVSLVQWGHLLHAACGITGRAIHPEFPDLVQDLRAWPSGGGLYPIEVYLAAIRSEDLDRSLYHYQVQAHRLAEVAPCPKAEEIERVVLADGLWNHASGLIILTGLFSRTQAKYGERGYRFVLLDAGHLAQNILLVCEDLRLGAVPLGGFHDDALARLLRLDPTEEAPLYAILIGVDQL